MGGGGKRRAAGHALLWLALGGCAAPAPCPAAAPDIAKPAESPAGPAPAPAARPPDVAVHLQGVVAPRQGDAEPSAALRVGVTLRVGMPGELRALEIEGRPDAVTVVSARDASGPLDAVVAPLGTGAAIRLGRDPTPPLEVVYDVRAEPARPTTVPVLAVDENHARVPFEWLALPRALDQRTVDLDLALGTVGGQVVSGGTTLAPGTSFRGVRDLGALRRGYAILGDVGTARLDAYEGHDHAIWRGFTSFDARWVVAESAGVRSMLDRWIGSPAGPAHGLVLVSERRPDVPFAMATRDRALWISADLSAPWDAAARLRVAQHFAQRFFGGVLWIGERTGAGASLGWFWSEGVARVAGREVLFDLGLIGFDEIAAELNRALADVVLSPLARADATRLLAAAAGQGDDALEARRVLMARGVLWASGLDARRRVATDGPRSLREVMRELFKHTTGNRTAEMSLEQLAVFVASNTSSPTERSRLLFFADGPVDADLSDRLAGTCHQRVTRGIARFEMGAAWDVAPPTAAPDAPLGTVREVRPGGPAARAGLRASDVLVSASYAPGRPDVEAKLVVRRDGKDVRLAFFPRGPEVKGPGFVRRQGARDETCSR